MKRFNLLQIKQDLRRTFLLSTVLSFTVFAWLRIIFFDIPFSFPDEGLGLLKTIVTYWALIFAVKIMLNFGLVVAEKLQQIAPLKWLMAKLAV